MKFKLFLLCLLILSLPIFQHTLFAQADSAQQIIKDSTNPASADKKAQHEDDDEFNIFLLVTGIVLVSAMIGAAIVGAFAAALFLLSIIAFISLGIISSSVMIGLYKKSFQAGFKSLIVILSAAACTILGAGGLWFIARILHLSITQNTALLSGAAGGMIGGLAVGFASIKIIQLLFTAFKNRMHIP